MGEVYEDQQRGQRLFKVVDDVQSGLGSPVAVLRPLPDADLVDERNGTFHAGKQCAEQHENNENDTGDKYVTVSVHEDFQLLLSGKFGALLAPPVYGIGSYAYI